MQPAQRVLGIEIGEELGMQPACDPLERHELVGAGVKLVPDRMDAAGPDRLR